MVHKKAGDHRWWRLETALQHGDYDLEEDGGSLNFPLFVDIAPVQPDVQTAARRFADAAVGDTYYRKGGPNARFLEKLFARIEGSEDALIFSTGTAAINCLLLELVERGGHLVVQRDIYGGTTGFLTRDFVDAGRSVEWVRNSLDLEEWERAIRKKTAALFVEIPSNPLVGLVDRFIQRPVPLAHSPCRIPRALQTWTTVLAALVRRRVTGDIAIEPPAGLPAFHALQDGPFRSRPAD